MIKSTQFLHKVSKFNYHFHNLRYCWSFKVHFCLRQTSIIIRQRTTNFICFICFFLAINVLHFVLVCIETDSEQLKQEINMKSTGHASLRSWMKTQIMNYNKSVDWFSPCLHHGKQGKAPLLTHGDSMTFGPRFLRCLWGLVWGLLKLKRPLNIHSLPSLRPLMLYRYWRQVVDQIK